MRTNAFLPPSSTSAVSVLDEFSMGQVDAVSSRAHCSSSHQTLLTALLGGVKVGVGGWSPVEQQWL